MKTIVDYEHYKKCPSLVIKLDRFNNEPCTCKQQFNDEYKHVKDRAPRLFNILKKLRFKRYEIKLK